MTKQGYNKEEILELAKGWFKKMKFDKFIMERFLGSKVFNIWHGHGSFLDICSRDNEGKEYTIWLYLTEWAITHNGDEICASDTITRSDQNIIDEIISKNIKYESFFIIDSKEFHIYFSNNIKIEIWANIDAYGYGSDMVMFSCNNKVIVTVSADDELSFVGVIK